ncbi:hypothetical protein OIU77_015288 [Salix suchowensis]|uniref:Uncharacterized protein n=1 Tax=Salix suchowensis TaxID=1278906 RepID=A0ABQ8ZS95_9ROSI|nr:hypothetical protein OIU77_015288 [Salix suchowensis]
MFNPLPCNGKIKVDNEADIILILLATNNAYVQYESYIHREMKSRIHHSSTKKEISLRNLSEKQIIPVKAFCQEVQWMQRQMQHFLELHSGWQSQHRQQPKKVHRLSRHLPLKT